MNKKILSYLVIIFLLVCFAIPVYADSSEASIDIPKTDPQVQAVNEAIERLDLSAAEVSEETVIEALEAEGIAARADIFAYVFDFAGLEAALADPSVNIILLLADIQMEDELIINRDISMSGVMGATITSSNTFNVRHFQIYAVDLVTLVFSNVSLDGEHAGGGIRVNSPAHIKGAVIQNCSNNTGAITSGEDWIGDSVPLYINEVDDDMVSNNVETSEHGTLETLNFNSGIILEDCTITNNASERYSGGGISAGNLTILNCVIKGNSGHSGGGVYSSNGTLVIENSQISDNTASTLGGGISARTGSASITNSSITNNIASSGGGIWISNTTPLSLNLEGTEISYNNASQGGGIYIEIGLFGNDTIKGGTFENNTANKGGAIYSSFSYLREYIGTLELSNMTIKNNSAINGGGIFISDDQYDQTTINEDVIFSGNTADKGYYMTDEDDIAIHDAHVFTTHFSEPFTQYAYNNFDISYTKGEEVPAVTASFYLRYSDTEPFETASVYAGQALSDKLPEGPEQPGLKFIGWTDINGVIYRADTAITEDVNLYPAYILD